VVNNCLKSLFQKFGKRKVFLQEALKKVFFVKFVYFVYVISNKRSINIMKFLLLFLLPNYLKGSAFC